MMRTQWLLLIYTAISLNSIFAEEHAKNTPFSPMSQLAIPDSTQIQVLETTDGSTNIGRIVEIGPEEIAFKTHLGIIHIPISKIKHIETISFDYALFAVHRDVQFSPVRSNIQAGTAQGTAPTMTL